MGQLLFLFLFLFLVSCFLFFFPPVCDNGIFCITVSASNTCGVSTRTEQSPCPIWRMECIRTCHSERVLPLSTRLRCLCMFEKLGSHTCCVMHLGSRHHFMDECHVTSGVMLLPTGLTFRSPKTFHSTLFSLNVHASEQRPQQTSHCIAYHISAVTDTCKLHTAHVLCSHRSLLSHHSP